MGTFRKSMEAPIGKSQRHDEMTKFSKKTASTLALPRLTYDL